MIEVTATTGVLVWDTHDPAYWSKLL